MTGTPRTTRDRLRDWMVGLFVATVLVALTAALLANGRLGICAVILAGTSAVIAIAFGNTSDGTPKPPSEPAGW